MIEPPAARVCTVRLRAADEGLVRRGALLFEDALRTASLPTAPEARLVIVRSFSVGRIAADRSPATLSLTIEQRLRQLSSTAVHADDPGARSASVVYFRDEIEPYICLGLRLARQEPTDAWFWPLVVPAWRAGMTLDVDLRNLLLGVMRTPTGPAAGLALVQGLHERGVSEPLLAALRQADGPDLLRASGWSRHRPEPPGAVVSREEEHEHPPSAWATLLDRWVRRWGRRDDRSAWIAAVALAAERPARLLDPDLLTRAERLISRVGSPGPPLSAPVPTRPARAAPADARARRQSPPLPSEPPNAVAAEPQFGAPSVGSGGPERSEPGPAQAFSHAPGRTPGQAPGGVSPAAGPPSSPRTEPTPSPLDSPIASGEPLEGTDSTARPAAPTRAAPRRPIWSPPGVPQPTSYAGLFFLLPLMARFGIASLLEQQPHLIDLDLPHRVLREAGRRIRIPLHDPVFAVLADVADPRVLAPFTFVAPPAWQVLATPGRWLIRHEPVAGGVRGLFDRSGRLALALWRGRAPESVRDLARNRPLRRGPPLSPGADLVILLESWITAMRRWCRRYAGVGLASLIRRPGWVTATRTHLDVSFPLREVDIRVRRAGLDIDPGWAPWFGRVVQFHYVEGGLA